MSAGVLIASPVGSVLRLLTANRGELETQIGMPGVVQTVSIPGDLTSLGTTSGATNGNLVWVQSRRAYFRFAVTGSQPAVAPDGRSVVSGVGGQWFRLQFPDYSWALQPAWEVDPANLLANDNNTGAPGSPLQTLDELRLRLDRQMFPQTTTVNLLSDAPEYLNLHDLQIANGAAPFRFIFTSPASSWTAVYIAPAPGITAVTAINRAANTPLSLTDANITVDPATLVGFRIRLSSADPTRNNATAFIVKKLSATSFRCTPFQLINPATVIGIVATVTPVAGDTYTVERMPGILGANVVCRRLDMQDAAGAADTVGVVLDSVEVQKGQTSAATFTDGRVQLDTFSNAIGFPAPFFTRSITHAATIAGTRLSTTGTLMRVATGSSLTYNGFVCVGGGMLAESGTPTLTMAPVAPGAFVTNDWLLQGVRLITSAAFNINSGGMAIFDASGPAFDCGTSTAGGNVFASGILYGSGNTGVGVQVSSAHLFQYSAAGTKPTITGSVPGTNDASVGGVNKAWGAIPFTDTAKMCGIVVV